MNDYLYSTLRYYANLTPSHAYVCFFGLVYSSSQSSNSGSGACEPAAPGHVTMTSSSHLSAAASLQHQQPLPHLHHPHLHHCHHQHYGYGMGLDAGFAAVAPAFSYMPHNQRDIIAPSSTSSCYDHVRLTGFDSSNANSGSRDALPRLYPAPAMRRH